MADDFEQKKRNKNIIVRGLKPNENTKTRVINMITTGLGKHITEKDIKYSIKLALKKEREGTETMKIAFYDTHL